MAAERASSGRERGRKGATRAAPSRKQYNAVVDEDDLEYGGGGEESSTSCRRCCLAGAATSALLLAGVVAAYGYRAQLLGLYHGAAARLAAPAAGASTAPVPWHPPPQATGSTPPVSDESPPPPPRRQPRPRAALPARSRVLCRPLPRPARRLLRRRDLHCTGRASSFTLRSTAAPRAALACTVVPPAPPAAAAAAAAATAAAAVAAAAAAAAAPATTKGAELSGSRFRWAVLLELPGHDARQEPQILHDGAADRSGSALQGLPAAGMTRAARHFSTGRSPVRRAIGSGSSDPSSRQKPLH